MARDAAAGRTATWTAYEHWLYAYTATFLVPLTAVYALFGPVPIAGQLLVASVGSLTCVFSYHQVRRALTRGYAVAAALVVAVTPSQVLWSSLTMKDAFVWTTTAALGLVAAAGLAPKSPRRLAMIVAAAAVLLALIESLRPHTLVISAVALALTWFLPGQYRSARALAGVALVVLVPYAFGHGLAAQTLLSGRAETITQQRVANASAPGETSIGKVAAKADLAYLPTGLSVMVLEPVPWRDTDSRPLSLAKIEMVIWYPLVLLALAGATLARRHAGFLAFPILYAGATLLTYSLIEGNLGTALRHRGELLWPLAVMAAFGTWAARERFRAGVPTDLPFDRMVRT